MSRAALLKALQADRLSEVCASCHVPHLRTQLSEQEKTDLIEFLKSI
jgi:hypothetical protein